MKRLHVNSTAILFVLTLLLQWIAGLGVLALTRIDVKRSVFFPVALLLGMYLHSVGVFALELMHIGIHTTSILSVLFIIALAANAWWPRVAPTYKRLVQRPKWTLRMYDVAALVISTGPLYIAVWATWYWPVTPFDAMAGIDLVARQTLLDGHINNQIFSDPSLRGFLSNQPYYAPYAMLMQVVYRSIGFAYGQVWLGVQCIAFAWLMFVWLRAYTHPFIACVLWLLLIMTPEWFGYQFLLQTDMANAMFFAIGVWFFVESLRGRQTSWLIVTSLFLAAAAWTRTETIVIIALALAASLPWTIRALGLKKALTWSGVIAATSLLSFALWHWLYFAAYLPVAPNSAAELTGFDSARGFSIASQFFGDMIKNLWLWGYTIVLFVVVMVASVVTARRVGNPLMLVWIGCILVALVLVGTVFTSALVDTTLRRGIFKVLPLMVLAIAQAPLVQRLSERLSRWELAQAGGRNK